METAAYRVFVDGDPASQQELDRFESVTVEQAVNKAWEARLEVPVCLDDSGQWTGEDETFMEALKRVRVELKVGKGDFVPLIDGPVIGHDTTRSSDPGKSAITLIVHDDGVLLNQKSGSEPFENLSDSAIAERIFGNYSEISKTIVETTAAPPSGEPYEVTRRGTDMELLRELGKRTDRQVGVLPGTEAGSSVGVFHSIQIASSKLPGSPDDLTSLVLLGGDRNIETFDLRFDSQRPKEVYGARLSFGDKTVVESRSRYRDTSLVSEVPALKDDSKVGEEMLRPGAGRGAELQQILDAQRDRRSRAFHATGTVRAGCYPGVLWPYRAVTVQLGTTDSSADYVVQQVTHKLSRSEYTQEFGLVSNSQSPKEAAQSLIPGGIF